MEKPMRPGLGPGPGPRSVFLMHQSRLNAQGPRKQKQQLHCSWYSQLRAIDPMLKRVIEFRSHQVQFVSNDLVLHIRN